MRLKDFSDKDVVFREGDKLNALYLVRYGNLKLVRSGAEGEEIIVNLLSTGDFYGGDSLFSESTARETGICSGECGVCSISSAELKKLIIKIPNIALKMLTYFKEERYVSALNAYRELKDTSRMSANTSANVSGSGW